MAAARSIIVLLTIIITSRLLNLPCGHMVAFGAHHVQGSVALVYDGSYSKEHRMGECAAVFCSRLWRQPGGLMHRMLDLVNVLIHHWGLHPEGTESCFRSERSCKASQISRSKGRLVEILRFQLWEAPSWQIGPASREPDSACCFGVLCICQVRRALCQGWFLKFLVGRRV